MVSTSDPWLPCELEQDIFIDGKWERISILKVCFGAEVERIGIYNIQYCDSNMGLQRLMSPLA